MSNPHADFLSKITNQGDQILARLALRREFVTPEQIDHSLKIQARLQSQKHNHSLGQILHKGGLLTERQMKALEMVTKKALSQLASNPAAAVAPPAPKVQAAPPGATMHINKDSIERMRNQMSPGEFKQFLLDTFLDGSMKGQTLKEDTPTPDPFGPYNNLVDIGHGGMALVYKVYDADMKMDVALKVMRPEISRDKEYLLRFLREASNTALIQHNNVVRLHTFGAFNGRLYFTLEYIEGKTLKQRMNEGRIPPKQSLEILRQTMEGLIAAHEQGIGHRDLKPANVMLTTNVNQFGFNLQGESNTVVKVTDFGLARMYGGEVAGTITQEGQFLGTAKYIAPELILGEDPTLQSDIFSLGIMAFQMFSGIPPFRVKQKVDYIEANLKWEAPLLHEVAMEIAPGVGTLVDAMLEKNPMDRPTADSLLRDIKRLENMGMADDPGPVDDVSSVFHPSRKAIKERRNQGGESEETDPRIFIAIGVAAFLLLILFIFLMVRRSGKPEDDSPLPGKTTVVDNGDGPKTAELVTSLRGFPDIKCPPLSQFDDDQSKLERFCRLVEEADDFYRRKKLEEAVSAWQEAKGILNIPELGKRLDQALIDQSLVTVRKKMKANQWEEVISLCEGIPNGKDDRKVQEILKSARRIIERQLKFKAALKQSRELESLGDYQSALKILDNAERDYLLPNPKPIDPDGQFGILKKSLRDQLKRQKNKALAEKSIKRSRIFLLDQSWDLSSQALEQARRLDAKHPEIIKLDRYIEAGRKTPKGYVFMPPASIEVFGERKTVDAMYVPKEPVSNKEYLAYLNGAGKNRRRPKSWRGGIYPTDKEEFPVLLVERKEAKLYAESLKGRLPNRPERTRLDRFLKLEKHAVNRANLKKEFEDGFRIIIPLPDLP